MKVSVPKTLSEFVESQVRHGHFSTPSEYLCSLIHEEQKRKAVGSIEALLLGGLTSGASIKVNQAFWDKKRLALNSRCPNSR